MNTYNEFLAYLKQQGIEMTKEQLAAAKLLLDDVNTFWMRGSKTGVTFLFTTLEDFYKHHNPVPK